MAYNAVYVYGIAEGRYDRSFNVQGIGERNDTVQGIPFKDVTAIISHTPFIEYDPTEANMVAHEKVIQEVLKQQLTIAPMRFCTVLGSKQDLVKLLQSAYLPFKRNILKIRNKLEFDIKVFIQLEKLREKINDDAQLMTTSQKIAEELHACLQSKAVDMVLEEQITDDMIMNASFLLHKEQIKAFYDVITDFDKQHTDTVKIRISGPTAPYNFVNMPTK
jgi:hypothetical protein